MAKPITAKKNKNVKLEIQALRLAQKTQHDMFTHIFSGAGIFHFNSADLAHPKLLINLGKAGELIYNTIKEKPVEFFYKSYATKFGAGVVPKELIEKAYYSCTIDDLGRLLIDVDLSKDSLTRKYLGKPEVRVVDDFIFNDEKMSTLQCAFFHLFNTRLKDEKWTAFFVSLQYYKDNKKITFQEFTDICKELGVFS